MLRGVSRLSKNTVGLVNNVTLPDSRGLFSSSLTNLKNKFVGTGWHADGIVVFGTSAFFYAIVLTAGEAYDARNKPDFNATAHARTLFYRSVTYPVIFGYGWPGWFSLSLVGEFFFMSLNSYRKILEILEEVK